MLVTYFWRGLGGSTKHILVWPIRAYRLVHLIVYELNLACIFLLGVICWVWLDECWMKDNAIRWFSLVLCGEFHVINVCGGLCKERRARNRILNRCCFCCCGWLKIILDSKQQATATRAIEHSESNRETHLVLPQNTSVAFFPLFYQQQWLLRSKWVRNLFLKDQTNYNSNAIIA